MSNIHESVYLAPGSVVLRDVTMAKDSSVWFNTVIRGDEAPILIGEGSNIQDNAVIHTLYEKSVTEIGNDVSIGHNVVVHGAKIGDMALIGMGSIILDHAEIGEGAIVAAGSVVLGGTKIGPHELWAGSPAKFKKMVDPSQASEINVKIAKNYLMYSTWYDQDEQ